MGAYLLVQIRRARGRDGLHGASLVISIRVHALNEGESRDVVMHELKVLGCRCP
jgi:hypothetical protein